MSDDRDILDQSWQPDGCASLGHEWLDYHLHRDHGLAVDETVLTRLSILYLENPSEWLRCREVLKNHALLRDVERRVRDDAQTIGRKDVEHLGLKITNVKVSEVYSDAPVDKNAEVPFRWELSADLGPALWRTNGVQRMPVAHSPILIDAIMVDATDGSVNFELAWLCRHKWSKRVVPREITKSTRELVTALSGFDGFPADANNAKQIVAYLSDYEAHNEGLIPTRNITKSMGWVGDSFVVGKQCIGDRIEYVSSSAGEAQLTRGVRPKGDLRSWVDAMTTVARYPPVMFGLYTALSPPLLDLLDAKNFVLDISGKTSIGKTTVLNIAASAWGDPRALVTSWDSTAVGFERRAAAMSGLPIFADDTKLAKSVRGQSVVPAMVYRFTDGNGRVRGSVKGLDDTASWRSVLLSTGEHKILDIGRDGGVAGRVLTLWGGPFGTTCDEAARLIRSVNLAVSEHHGHAGIEVARFLADQDRGKLKSVYGKMCDWARGHLEKAVMADGADAGVVDRLSLSVAVVLMAARVAKEALSLPWEIDITQGIWFSLASGAGVADREKEALRHVVSWATQNRRRFCVHEKHRTDAEPHGGWLGLWEQAVSDQWEWIGVWPGALDSFLSSKGYDSPKAIRRQWAEAGYLVQDDGKRTTSRTNELRGRPRLVKIKREAAEQVGDLGDESEGQGRFDF